MMAERSNILFAIFIFGLLAAPSYAAPRSKNVAVSEIVTPAFFNAISDGADPSCVGKKFYSRSAFLKALDSFPLFGTEGSLETSKREIAAFFAHVTRETGHFCFIEEINGASINYCDRTSKQFTCASGKRYHGRGPMQLTWNFNYGEAGESIGINLLKNPELVGKDPVIAFKAALWHWMTNVHSDIVSDKGFGQSIRAINGDLECDGGNRAAVTERINNYKKLCDTLGVSYGRNLFC